MTKAEKSYKFIFTHEEDVLDKIQGAVEKHPKVTDVFQDSGFWYSNGETGPEWFSMHVRCKHKDSDEVQAFIIDELKKYNLNYYVRFMGSFN